MKMKTVDLNFVNFVFVSDKYLFRFVLKWNLNYFIFFKTVI